ncbi:MAG: hypothetical protein JWR63_4243, partial [Conexibacter sp.]|nr:hypothetical protein [Conexibacter sp.]
MSAVVATDAREEGAGPALALAPDPGAAGRA